MFGKTPSHPVPSTSLQAQLAEKECQVELLQGSKKTVLPCMDSTKTNSAPSSPRPPRYVCTMDTIIIESR